MKTTTITLIRKEDNDGHTISIQAEKTNLLEIIDTLTQGLASVIMTAEKTDDGKAKLFAKIMRALISYSKNTDNLKYKIEKEGKKKE